MQHFILFFGIAVGCFVYGCKKILINILLTKIYVNIEVFVTNYIYIYIYIYIVSLRLIEAHVNISRSFKQI